MMNNPVSSIRIFYDDAKKASDREKSLEEVLDEEATEEIGEESLILLQFSSKNLFPGKRFSHAM